MSEESQQVIAACSSSLLPREVSGCKRTAVATWRYGCRINITQPFPTAQRSLSPCHNDAANYVKIYCLSKTMLASKDLLISSTCRVSIHATGDKQRQGHAFPNFPWCLIMVAVGRSVSQKVVLPLPWTFCEAWTDLFLYYKCVECAPFVPHEDRLRMKHSGHTQNIQIEYSVKLPSLSSPNGGSAGNFLILP